MEQTQMKKRRWARHALYISLAVFVALMVLAVSLMGQLMREVDQEQARQLRETLRRAAISCYAVEGRYPENLQYLQDQYGIQVDQSKFMVRYDVVSQNTMPIIEVIWLEGAAG